MEIGHVSQLAITISLASNEFMAFGSTRVPDGSPAVPVSILIHSPSFHSMSKEVRILSADPISTPVPRVKRERVIAATGITMMIFEQIFLIA